MRGRRRKRYVRGNGRRQFVRHFRPHIVHIVEFQRNPTGHGVRMSMPRKVTMLVLSRQQRMLLAETLRDIANVAAGAMVFGQFLSDRLFSPWIAIGGIGLWIVLVTNAIVVARGRS